jgi:transcriptional regulator of acetoin/glycerol metabolism
LSKVSYSHQIRNARERFLGNGELPDGLLPDSISRSWERCARTGLVLDLSAGLEPADTNELNELREKNSQLITQSQPEMESLYSHIVGTQSMVILSDAGGTILHAMGNQDFMGKAQRVALQPGVSWREDITGTNAIGTALVEISPVYVKGAEHFIERNGFLNCSAVPIADPHGNVIGVLDVSGDYRQPQEHTMGLVRMSAQMIENRLFNVNFASDIIIRFHTRLEFIGTLWEGIAVFSPEGKLIASNRSGAFQIGLGEQVQLGIEFEALFGVSLSLFLDTVKKRTSVANITLPLKNGLQLYVKVDPVPANLFYAKSPSQARTQPKTSDTLALDALNHGDAAMQHTLEKAKLAMGHDIPILVEGETGTGKELLAKAIHQSGARRQGPFIAINCAAIPEGLIESELFGHEEGAFTGSRRRGAMGRIQQAHGGTLFLDEIGEMPIALQASLLRVIQEREVVPLGGNKSIRVDIAIISATNSRLKEKVANHQFREDLYYRLNGLRLTLPALRNRTDFPALVQHLLKENLAKPEVTIHLQAMALMQHHPWPGNIRQLSHVLRSAIIFMQDNELRTQHLPEDFMEDIDEGDMVGSHASKRQANKLHVENNGQHKADSGEVADIASTEAAMIRHALAAHQGNMSAAANQLGISRATMYRKSRRLGLR